MTIFEKFSNVSFNMLFDACREPNLWRDRFRNSNAEPDKYNSGLIVFDVYDKISQKKYKDPFDGESQVNHFFLMNFSCQ